MTDYVPIYSVSTVLTEAGKALEGYHNGYMLSIGNIIVSYLCLGIDEKLLRI